MKKIYTIYQEYYKNNKLTLLFYVLLVILNQSFFVVTPIIISKLIDSAVYFENINKFLYYVFLALCLKVLFAVIMPLRYYYLSKIESEATVIQKEKIVSRLPMLMHNTLRNITIGYLLQLVDEDLENTKSLLITDILDLIVEIVLFIVVLIIVLKINFLLFLLMICVMPPFALISKLMIPKIQKLSHEYIIKSEKIKDLTDEIYNGSITIKLVNAYNFINKKVNILISEYKNILLKCVKINIIYDHLLVTGFLSLNNLAITVLGAYLVIQGHITVGVITLLSSYFSRLWTSFEYFMSFLRNYKIKMISVDRINNFYNLPLEPNSGLIAPEFESYEIKNVSYCIEEQHILINTTFNIKKGDTVLITGANGSGKSTFVRLLVNLITPSTGSILYNGIELSNYNLNSLRGRIGYIPAEPFVFSGNLEDNFFGKSFTSDFIKVERYLNISKDGENLSSGEKKKLQLTCGMLQENDVYILDEPLNFVDESSKKDIVETITKDFFGKTLIIISHDISLFDFCQYRYIMKNGQLLKIN